MRPLSIIYLYQNCDLYLRVACINYFSSKLRLVFEGGFYSRKYDNRSVSLDSMLWHQARWHSPKMENMEYENTWLEKDQHESLWIHSISNIIATSIKKITESKPRRNKEKKTQQSLIRSTSYCFCTINDEMYW